MDKNKSKLKKTLKVQQRRHNNEQKKMDSESSFLVEQSQDSESSLSSDVGEKDPDFGLPETSKQRRQIHKNKLLLISILIPLCGVTPDPTQWRTTQSGGRQTWY